MRFNFTWAFRSLYFGLAIVTVASCANSTPASEADLFSVGNWERYEREIEETQDQVDDEYAEIDQMADRISERRRILQKLEQEERALKLELLKVDRDIEQRRLELLNIERKTRDQIKDYNKIIQVIAEVQTEIDCYLTLDSYTEAEAARANAVFSAAQQISGPKLFQDPDILLDVSTMMDEIEKCRRYLGTSEG
jgi:chromosome segregation ATPase